MFRTARQRLVAWNVLVLTFILAVLGTAVYAYYSANLYKEVDQQLRAQQQRLMRNLDSLPGQTPYQVLYETNFEFGYRIIMTDMAGQVNASTDCPPSGYFLQPPCPPDSLDRTSKEALRDVVTKGTDVRTVNFHGDQERVLTFVVNAQGVFPTIVQMSRSVAPEQVSLRELQQLLIFGGLAGIVLAGLGSFFLANRALVPIRQAFARQREFTADASHELRTPLALIRANAEMMCRHGDRLPPGDSELVGEIISETDHLNRLVSDLLTLARADSERLQLSTKPVDFRNLVSDVHDDLHAIAESRGIGSHVSLNGPVVVEGDEVRLRQLLLILLDNALKYTDPGGSVDVSLQREDGRARLTITDTGIGIPSKDLPRIFDRFYRVDRAREHESGGTGLGLAIAQWIVEAHRGTIKVDSELGQGTRFHVDLPAT